VSTYFGNYDRISDWALSLGFVGGRSAILSPGKRMVPCAASCWPNGRDERVVQLRDFRYRPGAWSMRRSAWWAVTGRLEWQQVLRAVPVPWNR
jgi:hypothetical protein